MTRSEEQVEVGTTCRRPSGYACGSTSPPSTRRTRCRSARRRRYSRRSRSPTATSARPPPVRTSPRRSTRSSCARSAPRSTRPSSRRAGSPRHRDDHRRGDRHRRGPQGARRGRRRRRPPLTHSATSRTASHRSRPSGAGGRVRGGLRAGSAGRHSAGCPVRSPSTVGAQAVYDVPALRVEHRDVQRDAPVGARTSSTTQLHRTRAMKRR